MSNLSVLCTTFNLVGFILILWIIFNKIIYNVYIIHTYISRLCGQNQWVAMERKMCQIIGDSWKPLVVLPWRVIEGMVFCFQNCSDLLWEKKNSSDRENLLKFEAEGRDFAKILRSVEQFIQTAKGQKNFWNRMLF